MAFIPQHKIFRFAEQLETYCIVSSTALPSSLAPFLCLTLVGLDVSSNQVLEFETVGPHLLLSLTANGRHVAVLHLTGAAAGPRMDTHSQRLVWRTEGKERASDSLILSFMESLNLIQQWVEGIFHERCIIFYPPLLLPWIVLGMLTKFLIINRNNEMCDKCFICF